jgi:hypothetical protein
MEKVKVEINRKQQNGHYGTLGMPYLLKVLKGSDLYEIGFHDEMLKAARHFRATTLFCNGKKVYLDFWEYPTPTYTNAAYENGFDLIIKIQDRYVDIKKVHRYLNRKRMLPKSKEELQAYRDKIIPWTFFPSRLFVNHVGNEEALWEEEVEVDKFGFFCGKPWKCRNKIMAWMNEQGIETWRSDQGNKRTGRPLSDAEFVNCMKRSKFGIVLAGRASAVTDSKNRREIDYMMLKKPLLLNYKPKYYNELIEGKHYIHFDQDTDLNDLENRYNIEEIAENGYQWYLENVPPEGAANTFRKILREKLDI